MPALKDHEIVTLFEREEISAISVDTSVFDQFDCNLEYTFVRKLDQFNKTEVEVVFSDVVEREVQTHIRKSLHEAAQKVRAGLNQFSKKWQLPPEQREKVEKLLNTDRDVSKEAETRWNSFVKDISAVTIKSHDHCTSDNILNCYFSETPPFKGSGNKRHEFPDAFALLSLEGYAEERNSKVIIVSRDKGWKEFAAASKRLVAVESLQSLYSLFNSKAQIIAEGALPDLLRRHGKKLAGEVRQMIQNSFDFLDYEIDANSYLRFEIVQTDAHIGDIKFGNDVSILSADEERVSFAILVSVPIAVTAEFSFFIDDSDGATDLGSNELTREITEDFELELDIPRNIEKRGEDLDWTLTLRKLRIPFGEIQPHYLE